MDRVAQAKLPLWRWRVSWLDVVLAAVCAVLLVAVAGDMLVWATANLVNAFWPVLAGAALLLFPGLALIRFVWPMQIAAVERWPFALGLSCAIVPIMVLFSSLVGLRWNGMLAWLFLAFCAIAAFWPQRGVQTPQPFRLNRSHLVLVLLTMLALVLRVYVVRELPVAMFGDSYHHTIITQLLIEHGGLFSSWQPYAPLRTFTYHFGFHSVAAFFSMLSGLSAAKSVLIIGQAQSALAAPLVFLFTRRVLRNDTAALFAALLAVFVSIMPAYYVNWGRYTQLGGQTVLAAAAVCWVALIDATNDQRRTISEADSAYQPFALARLLALTVLSTTGVALTHYRVAVFLACFVVAYGLYRAAPLFWREKPASAIRMLVRLVGIGVFAGGLICVVSLPWMVRLREGALLKIGQYYLTTNVAADVAVTEAFGIYFSPITVVLALLGVVLLIWRREWRVLIIVGWAALTWIAANPYLIGLRGTNIVSAVAVLTGNYLAVMPLAGAGLALGIDMASSLVKSLYLRQAAQVLVGAVLVAWGLTWQQHILTPQTQLVFPADIAAMEWIRRETPTDAKIFVNSFSAWGGGVYVGSDGGWWTSFFSGRATNVQPAPYGTEAGEQPDNQLTVQIENDTILEHALVDPEAAQALKAEGYDYIYDGPGNTAPANREYIVPQALESSPLYQKVYEVGGVTIWKVR